MVRKSKRNVGGLFSVESLEKRLFLTGTLRNFAALGLYPGANVFFGPVHSGTAMTLNESVYSPSDNGDPGYANAPTGTVTIGWYGGDVLDTATLINPQYFAKDSGSQFASISSAPADTIVLNRADAGTPISSGQYAGDYILYSYYSGDDIYAPSPEIDAASYADIINSNNIVVANVVQFASTTSLSVTQQPSNTAVGASIDPSVKAAILNTSGSIITSEQSQVTVALASTSTGTGTLSGTKTVTTVQGIASFKDLSVDKPGQYSLTFTDDLGDATASGLFQVSGGKLVFVKPPKDGSAGEPMNPAVEVALEDAHGKIITSDSSSVVTLTPIGLQANPLIAGNSMQLVNGRATFSDLVLKKPDFYKLQADDGVDAQAVSSRFKITGDHLVFSPQPKNGDVNAALPFSVTLRDSHNRLVTDSGTSVRLALNTISGGAGAVLSGTTTLNFVGGIAAFLATAGPKINIAGTYTFTAIEQDASTGALLATTTPTVTSSKFTLAGLSLAFKRQPPGTVSALSPFAVTLAVVNKRGQIETTENTAQAQLSLNDPAQTGAALSGMTTATFVNGVATFAVDGGPLVNGVGRFTMTALEIGAAAPAGAVDTKAFTVQALKLKLLNPPGPFVAANPDVGDSVTSVQIFGVFDARGRQVVSIDNLPGAVVSAVAVSGGGTMIGELQASAAASFPMELISHSIFDSTSYVQQVNYGFGFEFSKTGSYRVTVGEASQPGASTAGKLLQPLSINCVVAEPVIKAVYSQAVVNQSDSVEIGINKSRLLSISDFFNELSPNRSVGISLKLVSGPPGGTLAGETSAGFQESAVHYVNREGVDAQYSYSSAKFALMFDRPGLYTITATEVISPSGIPFEPSAVTPVATTPTVNFVIRCLPG